MFSLICTCTNRSVNNQNAGDLRCHRAHCNVTVMNKTKYIKITYIYRQTGKQQEMSIKLDPCSVGLNICYSLDMKL